jgi:hypothetical protein
MTMFIDEIQDAMRIDFEDGQDTSLLLWAVRRYTTISKENYDKLEKRFKELER